MNQGEHVAKNVPTSGERLVTNVCPRTVRCVDPADRNWLTVRRNCADLDGPRPGWRGFPRCSSRFPRVFAITGGNQPLLGRSRLPLDESPGRSRERLSGTHRIRPPRDSDVRVRGGDHRGPEDGPEGDGARGAGAEGPEDHATIQPTGGERKGTGGGGGGGASTEVVHAGVPVVVTIRDISSGATPAPVLFTLPALIAKKLSPLQRHDVTAKQLDGLGTLVEMSERDAEFHPLITRSHPHDGTRKSDGPTRADLKRDDDRGSS